jgi:hypothetical protein
LTSLKRFGWGEIARAYTAYYLHNDLKTKQSMLRKKSNILLHCNEEHELYNIIGVLLSVLSYYHILDKESKKQGLRLLFIEKVNSNKSTDKTSGKFRMAQNKIKGKSYRVFHSFGQIFLRWFSLGSSQFSILPKLPPKIMLYSKLTKK